MRPIVITDDGRWHNTVQRMVILFVLLFSVQFEGCECMCECIFCVHEIILHILLCTMALDFLCKIEKSTRHNSNFFLF